MKRFFFLPLLIFLGCGPSEVFLDKVEFQEGEWAMANSPEFSFRISDTTQRYRFVYLIRNGEEYPFYNLYLTYFLKDSSGTMMGKQLQEIHLMHPKTGKPYGTGLSGIYDHEVIGLQGIRFEKPGLFFFKVKHYMRPDTLEGIYALGLRIEMEQRGS